MKMFGFRSKAVVHSQEVGPAPQKVASTFADLVSNRQSIDAEIRKRQQTEIATSQQHASALAPALNVSLADLLGIEATERVRRKRREVKPKYKHPTENLTWSGRDKLPKWMQALIAEGHDKAEYLIEKA